MKEGLCDLISNCTFLEEVYVVGYINRDFIQCFFKCVEIPQLKERKNDIPLEFHFNPCDVLVSPRKSKNYLYEIYGTQIDRVYKTNRVIRAKFDFQSIINHYYDDGAYS